MFCKHFRPEILYQVPVLRSLSGMSCDCDMQSLPTSHCPAFTSTHQVNTTLTYMTGSHLRAWECCHSSKFPEKSHLFMFVIKVTKRKND